ncbi:hypothetical protein SAMN05216312_10498 [Cohnella sp. OV330]|nr:hypothetical protein SAMN05216312_10498 [Cohnella sp. OV330]
MNDAETSCLGIVYLLKFTIKRFFAHLSFLKCVFVFLNVAHGNNATRF